MSAPTQAIDLKKVARRDKMIRTAGRYMFILPAMILFIIFTIVPVFTAMFYSVTNYNMIQPWSFVGLQNFELLFLEDDIFLIGVQNTLMFAIVTGPAGFLLSFGFAWVINSLKFRKAFTLAFYTPSLTSGIAMSVIWGYFFAGDRYGFFNNILINLGFIDTPILWKTNPETIMGVVIFITLWMSMGTQFLVFLAGLQGIPKELYEAGSIDGVKNKFQEMAYITWPQMKPQLLFGAINTIVGSFGVFDIVTAVAGMPSPDYCAHTIVAHLYDYAFTRFQMGYASAIAVILFMTTFLLGRLCMRIFRSDY